LLISLIVAMSANRCIGRDGQLPWSLPEDLRRFKQLTLGHSLLMGRKTFESIGRPLPGRTSYILSRTPGYAVEGCSVVGALNLAIAAAHQAGENELFVCGGEEVYRSALPLCERIYLTELEREVEGDCFFPEIPLDQFQVTEHALVCEQERWLHRVLQRK